MSPLITGSIAFDYLMRIAGRFNDRWPAQADGSFAAAYTAPHLSRAVGGCAGNVAYALRRLGDAPIIMATAGKDFSPYADYLQDLDISIEHIMVLEDFYTAQAYMVTDSDNNQFIVFHPGATAEAQRQSVTALPPPPLAIVSPNGKDGMVKHCRELAAGGSRFIFDPGQAVGLFNADELTECLTLATYAIFNTGEFAALETISGLTRTDAAAMTETLFITNGEHGSQAIIGDEVVHTDCVHLGETKDPTGCGDAYRGGLMYGLMRGWQLPAVVQFAAAVAAAAAVHSGGQGYVLSLETAAEAYEAAFHQPPPL